MKVWIALLWSSYLLSCECMDMNIKVAESLAEYSDPRKVSIKVCTVENEPN